MEGLTLLDKKWLCKLAAIVVRVIVAAFIARECTVVATDGANRIERFYLANADQLENDGYPIRTERP
jgi:hypothetical protein